MRNSIHYLRSAATLQSTPRSTWRSVHQIRRGNFLIAETDAGEVVGIVVAEIRTRLFYEPSIEGVITDFYVMPEWRRKGVGKQMMDKAIALLKSRGVQLISAEFPAQNQIAVNFYKKYGFRPLTNIYVKEFQ